MKLNISFIEYIKEYIISNKLFIQNHKSKYTLDEILTVIEYILVTGSSWRSLNLGIFKQQYIWQSFYYHFYKFCKMNLFKNIYTDILKKYFKTNISGKLKYLSIDSSFIKNEYASNVDFNNQYKKKRLSKLSLIVDSKGVPISSILKAGNISDQSLFNSNFKDILIDITCNNKNNKHKRYLLADSGYDSVAIKNKIKEYNIIPIIRYNKRNTKNKNIIAVNTLTKKESDTCIKRMVIENCFSWLYKNRRLCKRYDKQNIVYLNFLYIAFIKIIIKRF